MACIFCKSRLHDYRSCPIQYQILKQKPMKLGDAYFGKAPNVFIGRHGYPHVRVGILGTPEYRQHDEPLAWSQQGTPIPEIVRLRSELINSHFKASVKGFGERFAEVSREVSLAKRPVDVEVNLQQRPQFRISFDDHVAPYGPTVALRQARITENVAVDTRVDKATSATDLLAGEAILQLGRKGFDEHFLTKAFSMGNFGIPGERRLVPTRWSITAVDDIMGKEKILEIKRYAESDCLAYFGGHLGNYYLLCFFDEKWQYELFEQYVPSSRSGDTDITVETDYEPYEGRKQYVEETAGGYYAARLAILEHLTARKRQSSVLAIRIITEEYTTPLGVWVVREAVRKALATEPLRFADRNLLLRYAESTIIQRFGYDITQLVKRSRLVKSLWGQRKLTGY